MQEELENLIRQVYKIWKADQPKLQEPHPDEETIACFLENKLSTQESERLKMHLISCDGCMEAISLQLKATETKTVPQELVKWASELVNLQAKTSILEIILRLKEKALEIINTTGDILVGQELVPAAVLRSRRIKDFKDEVTILKDFKDIRVEIKIENKGGQSFNLMVMVKEKATQKLMKDLRITLIKDDLELESYLASSGKVTFEHVLLGKYSVEIVSIENKLASVLLDIKV